MPQEPKHRVLVLAVIARHLHDLSVRHLAYLFWLRERVASIAGDFAHVEGFVAHLDRLAREAQTENIVASPMTVREFLQSYATFWPNWTPSPRWARSVWVSRERDAASAEAAKKTRLADYATEVVAKAFPLISRDLGMNVLRIRDRLRRLSLAGLLAVADVARMLRPDKAVDYCAEDEESGDARFVSALSCAILSHAFPLAGVMVEEAQGDLIDFCHSMFKHYDNKDRLATITATATKAAARCPVVGELVEPLTLSEMLSGPLFEYEKCVAESSSGLYFITMLGAGVLRVHEMDATSNDERPVECLAGDLLAHLGPAMGEVRLFGLTPAATTATTTQ